MKEKQTVSSVVSSNTAFFWSKVGRTDCMEGGPYQHGVLPSVMRKAEEDLVIS